MSKKELKQRVRKLEAQIYAIKDLITAFNSLKRWDCDYRESGEFLHKELKKLFKPCFDNARDAYQARLEKDVKRLA